LGEAVLGATRYENERRGINNKEGEMDIKEARAWINGERSTINFMPQDPFDTWNVRIAQADAALTQQAYWIVKAHEDGLIKPSTPEQGILTQGD
jgi:hypothetical protein